MLTDKAVNTWDRTAVSIQKTFTNTYFQYMDKPHGKWIHTDNRTLIKHPPPE